MRPCFDVLCTLVMYACLDVLGGVLQDSDNPSQVIQKSESPIRFIIHVHRSTPSPSSKSPSPKSPSPQSKLIRVHYQLEPGVQSFTSLIVGQNMSAKEVLDIAVSKAAPSEPATDYCLVLVTPKGGMSIRCCNS